MTAMPPINGWTKQEMADEIIEMLTPGCSLNLGIGMPTLIAERMPKSLNVMIHSENGVLGVSGRPTPETVSPTLINAGKETIAIAKGASYFDSATSFGMIRGGHIDFSVLGGMEVDTRGNLANWMIPGKKVTGMGGAMDLVNGSKKIIVMLTHFSKKGQCKLKEVCDLPLTGSHVVTTIVSDLGIFEPTGDRFRIRKLAPEIRPEHLGLAPDLIASTES